MITKFLPWPADDGGKQRTLAVARRLAGLGPVVLCGHDDGRCDRAGLEDMGIEVRAVPWRPGVLATAGAALHTRTMSAARFATPAMVAEVRRCASESPVDLLQIEYLQMAFAALGVQARTRVLDLHNVESALAASYGRSARGLLALGARAESVALRAAECRVVPTMDTVVVVSEQERRRLPAGACQVIVCPNGCDPSPDVLPPSLEAGAVFVGALGWAPNAEAAAWFGQQVWPEVVRKVPHARLALVGHDPSPAVRALASSTVEVTGSVPDVAPYLAAARLALAPLRSGGGSRLKILEALDAGRPVVSTSIGVDGLEDLVGEGVVVADTASAMAEAVAGLLSDPGRAESLGRAGHLAVSERHSWDRALAPLLEAVAG